MKMGRLRRRNMSLFRRRSGIVKAENDRNMRWRFMRSGWRHVALASAAAGGSGGMSIRRK